MGEVRHHPCAEVFKLGLHRGWAVNRQLRRAQKSPVNTRHLTSQHSQAAAEESALTSFGLNERDSKAP